MAFAVFCKIYFYLFVPPFSVLNQPKESILTNSAQLQCLQEHDNTMWNEDFQPGITS